VIEFRGRGILLDIEGTTSSVRFVYDVMFPFVRRELNSFLQSQWQSPEVVAACDQIARDAGFASLAAWTQAPSSVGVAPRELVQREVVRLMDGDVKATGLKQLQGLIWDLGYRSGELQSHVYDDVPPALTRWNDEGLDVRIYSSGSVQAQKLFFGHTIAGNLLPQLRGHYDTTSGGKKEEASYVKIAGEFDLPAQDILFASDFVAELNAARAAGMQTVLAVRPGSPEVVAGHGHPAISSFDEIVIAK
jgi:enolase-phosphatase E1